MNRNSRKTPRPLTREERLHRLLTFVKKYDDARTALPVTNPRQREMLQRRGDEVCADLTRRLNDE